MSEPVKLVFFGDEFYAKSGTIMSSLYHENGDRSDWGKVNCFLRDGKEVHIRPCTDAEYGRAHRMLKKFQEK